MIRLHQTGSRLSTAYSDKTASGKDYRKQHTDLSQNVITPVGKINDTRMIKKFTRKNPSVCFKVIFCT